jgi:monoamine oxidase
VINQLKSVSGSKAVAVLDCKECIWSDEENTFEESYIPLYPHQNNGNPIFSKSFYDDKLLISGSESAAKFPGNMDGAVYSANLIAGKITKAGQLQ